MCDCITSLSTTIRQQTQRQRHGQPQLLQPQLEQQPVLIYLVHDWELDGNDNEIEPKRHVSRVVWAIGLFFVFSLC